MTWDNGSGVAPKKIKVTLKFTYKDCPMDVNVPQEIESNEKGDYAISGENLQKTANELFATLNTFGSFDETTNPLAGALKGKVTITPVAAAGQAVKPVELATPIQVSFKCSICPAGTPPAVKQTAEPEKQPKADIRPMSPTR